MAPEKSVQKFEGIEEGKPFFSKCLLNNADANISTSIC